MNRKLSGWNFRKKTSQDWKNEEKFGWKDQLKTRRQTLAGAEEQIVLSAEEREQKLLKPCGDE